MVTLTPPERLDAGIVVLRRSGVDDAEGIADAIQASLAHLRPWMSWATRAATSVRTQQARLRQVAESWERGTEFIYVALTPDEEQLVGSFGLHQRSAPGILEIGYWLHVDHCGKGYALAASRALTETGFALPGITRMEIRCDQANLRSAAVPRKLGYRLDRVEPRQPCAPGEAGQLMIWSAVPSSP
jgi:RimJ/RimL family protein N-acetyltransferase